jgi:hypothetical protein
VDFVHYKGNTSTYMESLIFQMKIFVILSPFPFPKSWTCRWGKNGETYSNERACEVDKNAFITWRIFPVCATTPTLRFCIFSKLMKSILKLSRIFNGDGHCALLKTGAKNLRGGW